MNMKDLSVLGMKKLNLFYDRVVIGYSGGPDSQALLYKAIEAIDKDKIVLVHINHGISDNADDWEQFCVDNANKLGVEIHTYKYSMKNIPNLESYARDIRYADFKKHYIDCDKTITRTALLTGHHEDDQIETFFLNVMRGSGVDGLASMPKIKNIVSELGCYVDHIRPLLDMTKKDIYSYLEENKIDSVFDESNAESDYSRNFFRNKVIPLIESHYGSINKQVVKCISNIQKVKKQIDLSVLDFEIESSGSINRYISFKSDFISHISDNISTTTVVARKSLMKEAEKYGIKLTHRVLDEVSSTLLNGESKSGYARVDFGDYFITVGSKELFIINKSFYENEELISDSFLKQSESIGIQYRKLKNSDYVTVGNKVINFKRFCEANKIPVWIKNKINGCFIDYNSEKQIAVIFDDEEIIKYCLPSQQHSDVNE